MTPLEAGAKNKPALDEASFQQVLAAAYVLQQHNDSLRSQDPRLDSARIVTQIEETRSLLSSGALALGAAARLIVDRLRIMTDAAGASISLTAEGYLHPIAESGTAARIPGGSIASHSPVATERLRNGKVFHSANAQNDIRLDVATCKKLEVGALLAVPVQRSGQIAGLLEVRWTKPEAIHECHVQAGKRMAELVAELLDRGWLKGESESTTPEASQPAKPSAEVQPTLCRVCGRPFHSDEAFCGNCSMPRLAGKPSEALQSKWASLWYMKQAQEVLQQERPQESPSEPVHAERQSQPAVVTRDNETAVLSNNQENVTSQSVWRRSERAVDFASPVHQSASPLPLSDDSIAPPSWDERISSTWKRVSQVFRLRMRRRDAVATMVALTLLVLAVWAWPTGKSPHLNWFESILVKLGVAQVSVRPPAAPAGNPDVRVWVDVHTALYYCPGSELYGKTRGGQFATQHEAQQDRFEPATGTVCE